MDSIKINGMSCQHCVGSVQETLEKIPGLSKITVDLDAGEATFDNTGVPLKEIKDAVNKIGFEAV